jgi:large subunit ribosomal protein L15
MGNAGSGKRADTAKRSYPADYFGKSGFVAHNSAVVKAINCRDVEARLDGWLARGLAKKEGDRISVDLAKLGYDKLIGSGLRRKVLLKVSKASEGAREHVKASGGELA